MGVSDKGHLWLPWGRGCCRGYGRESRPTPHPSTCLFSSVPSTGWVLGLPEQEWKEDLGEASQVCYWVRAMAASEAVPVRWQLGTGGRKPMAFRGTSVGFSEACAVSVLFYSNFPECS